MEKNEMGREKGMEGIRDGGRRERRGEGKGGRKEKGGQKEQDSETVVLPLLYPDIVMRQLH